MRLILEKIWMNLRRLGRSEDGFTMIAALGVMAVTTVMVTTAFVAAEGDINLTQRDLDNKRAYFAARAGVNEFMNNLKQDPNYWDDCPTKTSSPVPGTQPEDDLRYSYAPVPANGASSCQTSDPIDTMIDTETGTFRMRFTGTSRDSTRSFVASFRRNSPLDYLWYTIYEVLDPNTRLDDPNTTEVNEQEEYRNRCEKFHREDRSSSCDIDFISGDYMNGPMFTQDQFRTCGSPVFGRSLSDEIKSMGSPVSYPSGCSGSPQFLGQPVPNAALVDLPPANSALRDAAAAYGTIYRGPTRIRFLGGDTAQVTNPFEGINGTVNLPPIVYVENSPAGCSEVYTPYAVDNSYPLTGGCGTVQVSGNYTQPITIAATNDIIVAGDLCAQSCSGIPTGQAILGLVANNFVRVQHAVSTRIDENDNGIVEFRECGLPDNDITPSHQDIRIDAAILALQHSFIVDNYDCGDDLGSLTVNGAIAQKFRGTVGTHIGGQVLSGYTKDYTYDDRLASREPPYLFDLNEASWRIERETACVLGGSDPDTSC